MYSPALHNPDKPWHFTHPEDENLIKGMISEASKLIDSTGFKFQVPHGVKEKDTNMIMLNVALYDKAELVKIKKMLETQKFTVVNDKGEKVEVTLVKGRE